MELQDIFWSSYHNPEEVRKELKQELSVQSEKLTKYREKQNYYQQSKRYENDQRKCFRDVEQRDEKKMMINE